MPRRRTWVAMGLAALALAAGGDWLRSFAPQGTAFAHDDLPYYSHADFRPRWDRWSQRRTVGAFRLVDQRGQGLDQRLFRERPTIVSFFWSGCVTLCPLSVDLLKSAQVGMGARRPQVLLISDQPQVDPPEALAGYAQRLKLPPDWRLATGDPGQVFRLARRGLFTDMARRAPDGGPAHGEIDYLIDRHGRLRGLYNANSPADMLRLQGDYARLDLDPKGPVT